MVDEFIYQFQAFCQFRQRVNAKSAEELSALKSQPDVWSTPRVLNYLHVRIYIYIYIYIHLHIYIYTCRYVYLHIYINRRYYLFICIYTYIYT